MRTLLSIPNSLWQYLKGVRWELKQMDWLTWRQVAGYTALVVVFVIVFVGLVYSLDSLYVAVRNALLTTNI